MKLIVNHADESERLNGKINGIMYKSSLTSTLQVDGKSIKGSYGLVLWPELKTPVLHTELLSDLEFVKDAEDGSGSGMDSLQVYVSPSLSTSDLQKLLDDAPNRCTFMIPTKSYGEITLKNDKEIYLVSIGGFKAYKTSFKRLHIICDSEDTKQIGLYGLSFVNSDTNGIMVTGEEAFRVMSDNCFFYSNLGTESMGSLINISNNKSGSSFTLMNALMSREDGGTCISSDCAWLEIRNSIIYGKSEFGCVQVYGGLTRLVNCLTEARANETCIVDDGKLEIEGGIIKNTKDNADGILLGDNAHVILNSCLFDVKSGTGLILHMIDSSTGHKIEHDGIKCLDGKNKRISAGLQSSMIDLKVVPDFV